MESLYTPDICQAVRENDTVILMVNNKGGFTVKIERGKTIKLCKDSLKLDVLIGCSYGDVFMKNSGEWQKVKRNDPSYHQYRNRIREEPPEESLQNAIDNRHIHDTNTAQKLSYDDIQRLKKDKNVDELIETIVDNSETFAKKTKMAQEKYIMRKESRHVKLFYVRPCDLYNVCNCYFYSFPHKIGYINFANLGMMMYMADIRYGNKVMVFDHSLGLITGAVSQRLAGSGKIYRLVSKGVSDKIVHELGIKYFENIVSIDLDLYLSDQSVTANKDSLCIENVRPSDTNGFSVTEESNASPGKGASSNGGCINEVDFASKPKNADEVDDSSSDMPAESMQNRFEGVNKRNLMNEGTTDGSNDNTVPKKRALPGVYPLYNPTREEVSNCHVVIGNISYNKCEKLNQLVFDYTKKIKHAADLYLELGGRLVLFGQQYQPMAALQSELTRSDSYVNVKFDEVFIREYQMLHLRTHPLMKAEVRPFCGFIVSATKASTNII